MIAEVVVLLPVSREGLIVATGKDGRVGLINGKSPPPWQSPITIGSVTRHVIAGSAMRPPPRMPGLEESETMDNRDPIS